MQGRAESAGNGTGTLPIENYQSRIGDSLTQVDPCEWTSGQLSRIRHDIQHEVATILLLAEVIAGSADVGGASQRRIEQLSREATWLNQLLGAYHEATSQVRPEEWKPPAAAVRVDVLVAEVLAALRLTGGSGLRFTGTPAWAWTNRLAMWRALRNLLDNAFRAAGRSGQVEVSMVIEGDSVAIAIDDDGPGFGNGGKGLASLGLGIVQDFAVSNGGRVELGRSRLGGCCVRLVLPCLATVPDWDEPDRDPV